MQGASVPSQFSSSLIFAQILMISVVACAAEKPCLHHLVGAHVLPLSLHCGMIKTDNVRTIARRIRSTSNDKANKRCDAQLVYTVKHYKGWRWMVLVLRVSTDQLRCMYFMENNLEARCMRVAARSMYPVRIALLLTSARTVVRERGS